MFNHKKGDAVLVLFIYLTFLFFMLIVASLLYIRLASNQTAVDNICAEAASRVLWDNLNSQKEISKNDIDNKNFKYNNVKLDEDEAADIVVQTFAEKGMETQKVQVYTNGNILYIEGDVKLKTRNVLNPGEDFRWVHFKYKTRIYKNHL
ncbi:hypothetical protein [Thermoanaerobacter mathranii]|uniref:hypothetical protein n=1 Tax=Thermoanaerobacter mathranii TaxID=583357 RepID=UPI003D6AD43D